MAKRRLSCFSMRDSISWSSCVVKPSAPGGRGCVSSLCCPDITPKAGVPVSYVSHHTCMSWRLQGTHEQVHLQRLWGSKDTADGRPVELPPNPLCHAASRGKFVSTPTGKDVRGLTGWRRREGCEGT